MSAPIENLQEARWGSYGEFINDWLDRVSRQGLVERLWKKDTALWKKDSASQKEIKLRLGWLTVASFMKESTRDLAAFSSQLARQGFDHVLLLGMGGSSLAPEMFQSVFGNAADRPKLLVLDSTHPERVKEIESQINLERTLFIVSSKSGGTVELLSFFKYFFEKIKALKGDKAGNSFIAITDAGTPLVELAKKHGFRRIFYAPEDVGGRFSALTFFGLLPAALIGVDADAILDSTRAMMDRCAADVPASRNPAAILGVAMAVLAESGCDKLTLVLPEALLSFGDWVEQLVAESTGKEGSGIVPIVHESLGEIEHYGTDRFFVVYRLAGATNSVSEEFLKKLEVAGHSVLEIKIKEKESLGGECFRWEMATAIASALLKINAFDQPDVQAAKDRTKTILRSLEAVGKIPLKSSTMDLETFWENAEVGDYAAILAFLPDRPDIRKELFSLARKIRDQKKLAVTVGFGPRYLHSTGQLHKGGPNNGVFVLLTAEPGEDLAIPGEKYTFGQLHLAQAMGDFEALEMKGRWIYHKRLANLEPASIAAFAEEITRAIQTQSDAVR